MNSVLFIDLTPFYGGGQKFIFNVHGELTNETHFIVTDNKLFADLNTANKLLVKPGTRFQTIVKSINNYIKANNIAVVLLNGNRPIYLAPFIKGGVKMAYKHTSNAAIPASRRFLGSLALNLAYLFCKKIILLYKKAKNEVWFQKGKVEIINNSINILDRRKLKSNHEADIIKVICVSRMDENKGIGWLIDVFAKNLKNNNTVKLEIAGDGDKLEEYARKIAIMGLNNVSLTGFVEDVGKFLAMGDIFILPSKFEAFPLSILEAMSFSLPIIATNTGGIDEMVIDSENGYLIEYKNDTALGTALLKLIGDSGTRKRMGQKSFDLVLENFQFKNSIKKLERLLNE